jgi:predicted nucleic acid-binding protein
MSGEFVDTNVLIYAHDGKAGLKHERAEALMERLYDEDCGGLSVQVLTEFYSAATRKLGMKSEQAEETIRDLADWTIHRAGHDDLLRAAQLHRRHKIAWWDALILNSASELGCSILWSEDFTDGRHFGAVTVRNPFK